VVGLGLPVQRLQHHQFGDLGAVPPGLYLQTKELIRGDGREPGTGGGVLGDLNVNVARGEPGGLRCDLEPLLLCVLCYVPNHRPRLHLLRFTRGKTLGSCEATKQGQAPLGR
uniref:Uncharacterized protein n=1 Tax=Gadus morhua TaxID=8049 RepID=A0A8C5BIF9_GADMO